MITKLSLELEHYGDWTVFSENFDKLTADSVYFFTNPSSRLNYEIFHVMSSKQDNIVDFIRMIRRSKDIRVIKYIFISKNLAEIHLTGSYDSSIRKIFMERMSIVKNLSVKDGFENYIIYIVNGDRDLIRELYEDLKHVAKIKSFIIEEYAKDSNYVFSSPLLSKREKTILLEAYKEGYFNYPRNITLEKLSNRLGISKAVTNYYLRNGIRKIIRNYLIQDQEYC
ncbi:helix-turn-helix domain-containing protein [Acidianus brierleyi]|uniref:HTH bat-type domain-containing protein n=1 Tax=Acidianus brierleyi TaxID=41673 RepID=A0A2U9IIC2_9CREN|nr:helix-turn-helix domain-containing protein [Acidianus brierleyi]AWR95725.1 hypothetical protein DFR85_15160 [Acidianus brierleyi]